MTFKQYEADTVVIGAGVGGVMAAYKRHQKGERVILVDRGIRLGPQQVRDIFDSQSFMSGASDVSKIKIDIYKKSKITKKEYPEVFGGLARFYAGVSLRMREREFDKWPVSYADTEPYYMEAERLLQVSGLTGHDPTEPPRSGPYPLKLPPMSELSQKLMGGAQKMGLKPFMHPFAINFSKNCVRCNYCNQVPCAYGAKWNPDDFIKDYENESLMCHAQTDALSLVFEKEKAILLKAKRGDEDVEYRARNFIVAGGAVFSPLFLSGSNLPYASPHLGRSFMTHCLGLVVGVFPFKISKEDDFHKWFSVSDYYFEPNGDVCGLIEQDHLTTRKTIYKKIPTWLHSTLDRFYYNTCQLLVVAEDEPSFENRIEKDGNRVKITQVFSKKDEERRSFLMKRAKEIMKAAGSIFSFGLKGESFFHACGTCKMGTNPTNSVVNKNGLLWGAHNVYVCDASIFPTSSGVNPSLTIAAQALRIADKIGEVL
ncbi:GMC family oxidoreductase [bacterium]|nr:GMC family oxidoreductase [bacterium]